MEVVRLEQRDVQYPVQLLAYLGLHAPISVAALGNLNVLQHKKIALFCSVRCPGNLILQTYDVAQRLRHAGVSVVGGFHSPMEHECLRVLLRGAQPIIKCPARSIDGMRVPAEYKQPLHEGRMLFLSPFIRKERRPTVQTALYRNQFVAALADRILIAHAEPSSKTEQFIREVLAWGKRVLTLESGANRNLIALGAVPVRPENITEEL